MSCDGLASGGCAQEGNAVRAGAASSAAGVYSYADYWNALCGLHARPFDGGIDGERGEDRGGDASAGAGAVPEVQGAGGRTRERYPVRPMFRGGICLG